MYLLSSLLWLSVAIIALVALWLRWRPDRASRCGQCGTAIDRASSTCPKCNHDLREAGVSTPAIRRHGIGPMRPWLIWFLVAMVPLVLLIFWLQQSGEDAVLGDILCAPQRLLQFLAYWFGPWPSLILIWPPIIVLWREWCQRQAEPDPQCGRCGYGVRGISSMTCPECGSNLQEVGIVTPAVRQVRRFNRPGWVVGWFLSLLPLALLTSTYVLGKYGPNELVYLAKSQVICSTPAREIVLNIQETGRQQSWGTRAFRGIPPVQEIELQMMDPRHSSPQLRVEFGSSRCSLVSWAGWVKKDLGQLDVDKVHTWLNSAGLDTTQPDLQAASASILRLVYVQTPSGPLPLSPNGVLPVSSLPSPMHVSIRSTTGGTSTVTMGPQWWGILVAAAFWLLIWLLGIWLVLRRSRSSIEADTVPSLSPDAPS